MSKGNSSFDKEGSERLNGVVQDLIPKSLMTTLQRPSATCPRDVMEMTGLKGLTNSLLMMDICSLKVEYVYHMMVTLGTT